MLFRMIDVLRQDPVRFVYLLFSTVFALLVAITVHEFSHGLAADRLGDDTARKRGRLSLNPLVHLDPIGTLLLFLVGFGWGKPVPVNPFHLKNGPKSGMAMVGFAGPLANLVAATCFALPVRFAGWGPPILDYIIFFNIVLAIFNLIPIPPLDGFNVLLGLVPNRFYNSLTRVEPYGPIILIFVIFADSVFNLGILNGILGPAVNLFSRLLLQQSLF